ncbi:MAG: Uroporphyrinogen deCOase protein [Candidatus Hydrogenedentes bacterium]|nr:Uroporphyrinogen deCOase protein [Candidatus Hydrogenedentota bacterium]
MTPKERVTKTIAHEQPDRVAIDYAAQGEVSEKLSARLGLRPGEWLGDRIEIDLRGVGPSFRNPIEPLCYADPTVEVTSAGVYRDIWGVGFVPNRTSIGFYMDLAEYPMKDCDSIEQIHAYPWPTADLWDYSAIGAQARAGADYYVGAHSRGIFEISWFLRGFDTFLTDLAMEPDRACAVMDHVQNYLMERTERVLEAGGGAIDMMEYNDDVGGQDGLLISPAMWREHLKPRMAAFIALCRRYGAKVRYHSCGGVRDIVPDLIEIGVDVLNPVQALARGMEPESLKAEFGASITLNGGIDTQQFLPNATPDEVRETVKRLIEVLNRDGGYILAPSHVFQGDVPIENIVAMYETALGHPLNLNPAVRA